MYCDPNYLLENTIANARKYERCTTAVTEPTFKRLREKLQPVDLHPMMICLNRGCPVPSCFAHYNHHDKVITQTTSLSSLSTSSVLWRIERTHKLKSKIAMTGWLYENKKGNNKEATVFKPHKRSKRFDPVTGFKKKHNKKIDNTCQERGFYTFSKKTKDYTKYKVS